MNEEIVTLYRQRQSVPAIARWLGISVAEVQAVLVQRGLIRN